MGISDEDLSSNLFFALKERQDCMFDNTLMCDEVWIDNPRPGQADTRYYLKSNLLDDQLKPIMLKPDGKKLYQLTRAFHLYNFPHNQVDYH